MYPNRIIFGVQYMEFQTVSRTVICDMQLFVRWHEHASWASPVQPFKWDAACFGDEPEHMKTELKEIPVASHSFCSTSVQGV